MFILLQSFLCQMIRTSAKFLRTRVRSSYSIFEKLWWYLSNVSLLKEKDSWFYWRSLLGKDCILWCLLRILTTLVICYTLNCCLECWLKFSILIKNLSKDKLRDFYFYHKMTNVKFLIKICLKGNLI